ncbi:MAG: hypothetical protein MZU91_11320 [Desulfosudis oleivorans]|nr:hypothetical protein [Desulfosudis oleivorans]
MSMKPTRFVVPGALLFLVLSLLTAGPALKAQDPDCPTCGPAGEPEGCTVIMVGKAASTDGSVMTTHTCDCGELRLDLPRYIPAADHKPGDVRKIYHIGQFGNWAPDQGLKWERRRSDDGPAWSSPRSAAPTGLHPRRFRLHERRPGGHRRVDGRLPWPRWRTPTPAAKFDITMLTLIAMERAGTAREADPDHGRARREIRLRPHGHRRDAGRGRSERGLGVRDHARRPAVDAGERQARRGLVRPARPRRPRQRLPQRVAHRRDRPQEPRLFHGLARTSCQLAVDQKFYDPKSRQALQLEEGLLTRPTSARPAPTAPGSGCGGSTDLVAPSQKFSPETLNDGLPVLDQARQEALGPGRHGHDSATSTEGTPYWPGPRHPGRAVSRTPTYLPYGFELDGKRYNTAARHRRQPGRVRDRHPEPGLAARTPIGGIVWLAWGAQDTSCFMPLYAAAMNRIPRSFEIGDHWNFDRGSARWAFDYVDFHTQVVYSQAIEDVRAAQKTLGGPRPSTGPTIDRQGRPGPLQEGPGRGRQVPDRLLPGPTSSHVLAAWWKLGDDLLVKYNHMWVFDKATRKRGPLKFPDWWLKLLVEYNQLTPQPAAKK